MKLHKPSFINTFAKRIARPLSKVACARPLYTPLRMFDAFLNSLHGKGSGTGWGMSEEVHAAAACIHREQPVCFDVGANIGTWSKELLEILPGARIYMFDPSPGCQATIREKNLPNTTLIPAGMGEHAGKAVFHFSSPTDKSASLYVRGDTPFLEKVYKDMEVEIVTIDDVIAEKQIPFIDFIKMDIEGHELFALHGAMNALATGKIGALSFEFGCTNVNSRTFFKDFWDLLTAAGFSLARVTPSGKPITVVEYYEELEYFRGATNYVATLKKHPYAKDSAVAGESGTGL